VFPYIRVDCVRSPITTLIGAFVAASDIAGMAVGNSKQGEPFKDLPLADLESGQYR
jgi:hypothetical protein